MQISQRFKQAQQEDQVWQCLLERSSVFCIPPYYNHNGNRISAFEEYRRICKFCCYDCRNPTKRTTLSFAPLVVRLCEDCSRVRLRPDVLDAGMMSMVIASVPGSLLATASGPWRSLHARLSCHVVAFRMLVTIKQIELGLSAPELCLFPRHTEARHHRHSKTHVPPSRCRPQGEGLPQRLCKHCCKDDFQPDITLLCAGKHCMERKEWLACEVLAICGRLLSKPLTQTLSTLPSAVCICIDRLKHPEVRTPQFQTMAESH